MKTTALFALIAVAVAAPAAASAQTAPAQNPAAAARLPDTFSTPAQQPARPATPPAPPAPPAAPDIARAQTALLEVIANLKSGEVDYSPFSADLAAKIREQSSQIGGLLTQFGDIQSVRHLAQPDGVDVFRVDFKNQSTEWMIGFDNEDQIAALLFRPVEQ
ncbi:hypothetical protein GCM10009093_07760 [Brevundimonas terrae]|uniref:DUF3887 domain-containing protein n=1 Tax=Brevundimonas terrae TaxID=363631 RepID=A0ABP3HWV2_9CAUL|nr:hypothetical protein [Brevundimonas terrae]NIJ25670.1 pyruvate/2-oxoglutarate dehydrogenase complex dihydrolipoamide acyltransferase (E2) component [Brevundimonas terrae]